MKVVNPREEAIRIESERITTLSDPVVEARSQINSSQVNSSQVNSSQPQSSLADVETLVGRRIAEALSQSGQPEPLLSAVAAVIGEAYDVQACFISMQLPDRQRFLAAWFARSHFSSAQQTEILTSYAAIAQPELSVPPDFISSELSYATKAIPIRAVLGAPQRQEQANGVICLMRAHSHCWTELEIETLEHVATQIAIALSQLFLQQKVAKQAQYQALLRQVTLSIQDSLELSKVQQIALEGMTNAIQVERAFVLRIKFWDPRQSIRSIDRLPKARVVIDSTWQQNSLTVDESQTPAASFWVSECVVCQTIVQSTAKSIAFGNLAEFPSTTEAAGIAPIFDPTEMQALMLVPLESKNRLLGFIVLQQSQPRVWQPEDIELTELIGAQISAAIIQTETLRQVESLVEERTAQLQQSLELQAKLYEITRKQIEKLREMNQRMDEFLSTLSHELRTPLTSMMLAIRMLRQANLSPERRQQYLNILEQQCAQETSLINDLLALQELETKQVAFQLQRVNLHQALSVLAESFNQRWAAKGLQLELDLPQRSPILNTDLASLNRILLELLTNAGKYAEPNSTVYLSVVQQPAQQVQIALTNIGAEISQTELPHIFDKFRRCQGMTQNAVPGTGLGLALVKSLVQHLNGTIAASSIAIEGSQSCETCFTLTLPQNLEIAGA